MIKKNCKTCKKEFKVRNYRNKTAFYCSQKCVKPKSAGWSKGTKGVLKPNKTSFREGFTPWNKGKTGVFSKETLQKMSGSNNHLWRGGITPINVAIRMSLEYKLWRDACFARDGYTCQKTGEHSDKLIVHHILNFSSHPELRFSIDNGITLSRKVHNEFHKKYGQKNNNREQLEEFLNNKLI